MNSKDLSSSVIILKNITGAKIVKETHISYAVIGDEYVYKIKKPVDFGFLDYRLAKSRKMYSILEHYNSDSKANHLSFRKLLRNGKKPWERYAEVLTAESFS